MIPNSLILGEYNVPSKNTTTITTDTTTTPSQDPELKQTEIKTEKDANGKTTITQTKTYDNNVKVSYTNSCQGKTNRLWSGRGSMEEIVQATLAETEKTNQTLEMINKQREEYGKTEEGKRLWNEKMELVN
jgi:hypothetical protein